MIVVEVNEGPKVPYEVAGNKIFFNDELMLNLEKYERDYEENIDICENDSFALGMGLGRKYVAQITIPAREYVENTETVEIPSEDEEETKTEERTVKTPVPFDIKKVTLSLWGVE